MPRKARIVLKNTAHHIIQRGHNRQAVFVEPSDYQYYLSTLREWKEKLGVQIYGYCLMTNHVHLIANPGYDETHLGLLMKRLAGRQTRYVNYMERRIGSLWAGRNKASPIDTDEYLLACSRYVDMNPVRAGMVSHPQEYPWSSYRQKAGLEAMWLDIDPCYSGLDCSIERRQNKYAIYVAENPPQAELEQIRSAVNRSQLTGSGRFIDEVESRLGIRVENRGQGRPKVGK